MSAKPRCLLALGDASFVTAHMFATQNTGEPHPIIRFSEESAQRCRNEVLQCRAAAAAIHQESVVLGTADIMQLWGIRPHVGVHEELARCVPHEGRHAVSGREGIHADGLGTTEALQTGTEQLKGVVDLVFVGCHEDGLDAVEGGDPWGNGKRVAEQQKPLEGVPIL